MPLLDMEPRFHPAQRAIAAGDVDALAALLAADPALATARSRCSHPTLLQCLVLHDPPPERLEEMIDLLAVGDAADLTERLIAACCMGNHRAAAKLLDLGASIEGTATWSPLEEALYWGFSQTVDFLLERGAVVDNLRKAAALGRLDYMSTCFDADGSLASAAGEVAWPFGKALPEEVRCDPRQIVDNALVYAAAWGQAEAVRELLARGGRINAIPAGFDFAGTPLHYAALRGRRDMVDRLLSLGADPTIRDSKVNATPADWAAHDGHAELAEYMRSRT